MNYTIIHTTDSSFLPKKRSTITAIAPSPVTFAAGPYPSSALLITFYSALDGYGPAANVTGDGAIAVIVDRFFGKKDESLA